MENKPTWQLAEQICEVPAVDEAIRTFVEDNTGDNAIGVVLAVLEHQAATEAAKAKKLNDDQPVMYCVPDKNGKPLFGKGWMFSPVPQLEAPMPLYVRPAAKATGTAGEQWKPKALQGPRKSIFYGGNTNEHLNPLVVLISAEDYEKCCSLCEAPKVPHEMAYTVGGVADVSYVNGWNDCRDTVLGKIDDDPTNAPAEAARQPAPVVTSHTERSIRTWRERCSAYAIQHMTSDAREAIASEIADLRSALAATAAPVLSDEQKRDIENCLHDGSMRGAISDSTLDAMRAILARSQP